MNRIKEQTEGKKPKTAFSGTADAENQTVIDSYDYLGNSASATDCTGLIPSAPKTRAERKSYEEVYHYQPKPSREK